MYVCPYKCESVCPCMCVRKGGGLTTDGVKRRRQRARLEIEGNRA